MNNLGDFDASAVIYGKFTTFRPSTGAAFTLGGTPALSVYKDNSTTQSTTGVTLTADFDSVTGLNHFAIDTSADGTFYAAGSFFDIVITTGTVDSVSVVGACVGQFTIRKTSSLKPATAGRTIVVDAAGLADATTVKLGPSGSGTAQTARDVGASVLLSAGTGTGQLDFTSGVAKANMTQVNAHSVTDTASGVLDVNAKNLGGTAQTGRDVGASVLLSSGTGTGQLDFTSGVVKSNLVQILGTALTETAGQIAAAFKQFFDIASPTGTMKAITNVVTATNLTTNNDKTGYALTSAYDAAKTAAQAGDAMTLTSGERNATADALLNRDMSTGTDSGSATVRTPRQAFRFLRNKWTVIGTALTVYKEDDSTSSWTGTVGTTPGADPISSNDPAGP